MDGYELESDNYTCTGKECMLRLAFVFVITFVVLLFINIFAIPTWFQIFINKTQCST